MAEDNKNQKIIELFLLLITFVSIVNSISVIDYNFAFSLYSYIEFNKIAN